METNHYKAQEGMTYQRKIDGYIMGNEQKVIATMQAQLISLTNK